MTDAAIDSSLSAGLDAHRKGDLATAIRHYEAAIATNGGDSDAQSLYGMALLHSGRLEEAKTALSKAVELAPDRPGLKANFSEYFRRTGRFDLAIAELKKAVELAPDYVQAWMLLGENHISNGDYAAAADALDKALQLDSGNYPLALRLARAFADAGNYPAAFYAVEHAEKLRPDDVGALQVRLDFARVNRDWTGVESLAQQLIKRSPDNPSGWRELANAFFETGRIKAAAEAFEKVLEIEGRTPANLTAYAGVALRAGLADKAAAALDEAEAAGADAAVKSAQALRFLQAGDLEKARAYCEEAVALDPEYLPVYPHLSALRKGRLDEAELSVLMRKVENPALRPASRSMASFVVAHHHDAMGDIDRAFAEYERANALAREHRRLEKVEYDRQTMDRRAQTIRELFSNPADFERFKDVTGGEKPMPIFVVGAPRSGTTLVESVLGGHSKVHAGGELPALATLLEIFLNRGGFAGPLSEEERERYVGAYWAQAPETHGAFFLTDKALLNNDAIGLIAQMFPKSPIIRVRRNPVEAGLSIYRHEFTKFWAFTDDFEHIAHFLALGEKMGAHWSALLGDRMTTVQYETFVSDFDKEARRLVEICGLAWEESCAERGRPGSAAATISAVQAREPVELSPRAGAYARHIAPLVRALEAEGLDLETGALKSV